MVTLGVRCASEADMQRCDPRRAGLWCPSIPEPELVLENESSVRVTYQEPLHHIMFGGPGGRWLGSLKGVSVYEDTGSLEFRYHDKTIPRMTAGLWPPGIANNHFYVEIDGPGGERIVSFIRHSASIPRCTNAYFWDNPGRQYWFEVRCPSGHSSPRMALLTLME